MGILAAISAGLGVAGAAAEDPVPKEWTEPITGIEFVLIEAGSFTMGTPNDEPAREAQEAQHRVTLTRPFYMGRYEVTQQQWHRIMGDRPSEHAECGPSCPVETVSLDRIRDFIVRVNNSTGEGLRLPSEAEWEYACRAGSQTAFSFGETLRPDQASFDGSDPYPGAPAGAAPSATVPVGSYPPNAWGLYDFHGSVWEWTSDRYCPYAGDAEDPVASCDSALQVIRGGSWLYGADSARCGLRYTHRAQDDGPSLGFRLARDLP